MKKSLPLAAMCLSLSFYGVVQAQNKTLGVGVSTPNPNAALHVESPTGNQGFIMPRLTSSQRQGMTSLLVDTDKGLMLYDTDLNTIFIWNGAGWSNSAEVAGGPKLAYPYADTIVTSVGTGADLFKLIYAGTQSAGVASFENQNPNNTASALNATTASAGGYAVGASNEANGVALALSAGGLQITTQVVTTGSIAKRAAAYQLSPNAGTTTFTLDFGPKDGEVFMIYNESGQNADIIDKATGGNVATVQNGEGMTFVVFPGGVIRAF